jgi:hypothetical protein
MITLNTCQILKHKFWISFYFVVPRYLNFKTFLLYIKILWNSELKEILWNLRFSQQWRFMSWSTGLWCYTVMCGRIWMFHRTLLPPSSRWNMWCWTADLDAGAESGRIKRYMAKHSINLCHCIQFHNTSILAKKSRCMECIIREVSP